MKTSPPLAIALVLALGGCFQGSASDAPVETDPMNPADAADPDAPVPGRASPDDADPDDADPDDPTGEPEPGEDDADFEGPGYQLVAECGADAPLLMDAPRSAAPPLDGPLSGTFTFLGIRDEAFVQLETEEAALVELEDVVIAEALSALARGTDLRVRLGDFGTTFLLPRAGADTLLAHFAHVEEFVTSLPERLVLRDDPASELALEFELRCDRFEEYSMFCPPAASRQYDVLLGGERYGMGDHEIELEGERYALRVGLIGQLNPAATAGGEPPCGLLTAPRLELDLVRLGE